jgi:hypothetical protein
VGFAYDETSPGGIHQFIAVVQKDELVEQLFHRGLRQLPGCTNIDIQADLESQLHEKLLKKVLHARINESIKKYKATAMASQKGITGVDFRKGLKASEEQKKKKGNTEKKVKV